MGNVLDVFFQRTSTARLDNERNRQMVRARDDRLVDILPVQAQLARNVLQAGKVVVPFPQLLAP